MFYLKTILLQFAFIEKDKKNSKLTFARQSYMDAISLHLLNCKIKLQKATTKETSTFVGQQIDLFSQQNAI